MALVLAADEASWWEAFAGVSCLLHACSVVFLHKDVTAMVNEELIVYVSRGIA
jgi:hypothetical protein